MSSFKFLIDEAKVKAFADLIGDYNRLHLDAKYAATTRFGKPIAHGMLVASFISPCLVKAFGDGTIYVGQSIEFLKPVYVGDEIEIIFEGTPQKHKTNEKIHEITVVIKSRGKWCVAGLAAIILPKNKGSDSID